MIEQSIIEEIDRVIKETWLNEIPKDYDTGHLLKEASLQCGLYYYLRKKLHKLLEENDLRIYPEFHFSKLNYHADIAIVQIDPTIEKPNLRDKVIDVIAVMELKYDGGNSVGTANTIRSDLQKIKNYIQSGRLLCQYYFAVIYETECVSLNWLDKRSTNKWAKGCVTELNAGGLDGYMYFEVNSYNEMNNDK